MAKKITKDTYLNWYRDMLLWRKLEDKASALYIQQKIRGFLHLYNGQEAILAGCIHAINPKKDKMITAYRNHVQPIAMGVDPKFIMAELMGKVTGCSKGNGGSMHMFSKKHNFYGGHGIVGGQIPLGAGLAFADKYNGTNAVTLCFMGDGAVRQGSLHETFNLAMLWKLPVVFIVENNGYAMGTSVERTANHTEIWKLGLGYEMPSEPVDGMNPVTICRAVEKAVENYSFSDCDNYEVDFSLDYDAKVQLESIDLQDTYQLVEMIVDKVCNLNLIFDVFEVIYKNLLIISSDSFF